MKVAILDGLWEGTSRLLEEAGFTVHDTAVGADAVIVRSGIALDAETLTQLHAHGLRAVVRAGSGLDNIDLSLCRKLGIEVVAFPGANKDSVAEVTVCFMLLLAHRMGEGFRHLLSGSADKNQLWGDTLTAKTIGIVGYGHTGQATVELLEKLGVERVKVYSRRITPDGGRFVSFEDCLDSDIVSLHVPLTPETRHLLNRDRLQQLKPGACLINMSRRDVVDHAALSELLAAGHLAGYATDVLDPERDRELLKQPRVFATPHLGAQSRSVQRQLAEKIVRWLCAWREQGRASDETM